MKERIERLHGSAVLKRSALRLNGGEEVLRRVFGGGRCRTVLEIGTYRGCTAALLAKMCVSVISVDLKRGQLEAEDPEFDRAAFWRTLGLSNIEFHAVGGDAEKASVISRRDFDGAFIDGSHTPAAVRLDFDLVRRCGYVLFHDYGAPGVQRFVDGLRNVQVIWDFALWTG